MYKPKDVDTSITYKEGEDGALDWIVLFVHANTHARRETRVANLRNSNLLHYSNYNFVGCYTLCCPHAFTRI